MPLSFLKNQYVENTCIGAEPRVGEARNDKSRGADRQTGRSLSVRCLSIDRAARER